MKIHFVGIGGIGLSALARYMKLNSHIVSGSDVVETPLISALRKEGIEVKVPHSKDNINNQDLVVYTAVAKSDNPELLEARRKNIKTLSRRGFLPYVVKNKKVISVCGAHGKSTTTAILASILDFADALIGAESKEFSSNMRYKGSKYLVFEADESDGSFIDSNPLVAVVTNTEPEHMEFYNYDLDLFYSHYKEFLKKASIRVVNKDDKFIQSLSLDMKKVSINDAKDIKYIIKDNLPKTIFKYKNKEFEVYGFGEHLILDTLLAIESASEFISLDKIQENILNYKGIKKRFDILYNDGNFALIDDYGHHPTEIRATLKSARTFAKLNGFDKIIAIWQPHKYSRTVDNLKEFVKCFEGVDELIILPVWSAGEKEVFIDFEKEFKRYNPVFSDKIIRNRNSIMLSNGKKYKKNLIIGFGAGDITYQLRKTKDLI